MAYQKKTGTTRKKTPSAPHLSNIVKPRGMSLEGWQTALRRQAALKENFGIGSGLKFKNCHGKGN